MGPRNMRSAFVELLRHEVACGRLDIDDLPLAAEQFVSMCKGFSDLERRFGAEADPERNRERIEGAVEVFEEHVAQRARVVRGALAAELWPGGAHRARRCGRERARLRRFDPGETGREVLYVRDLRLDLQRGGRLP